MAVYRRVKNNVTSENGDTSIIIGQEGLSVPSGEAKLTVGQVEKLTGVPRSKMRYYDAQGLLCPERTGEGKSNNRKLYGADDLGRLQAILTLAEYRFDLNEIKQILDGNEGDLYEAIALKLAELKREEARLRALVLFAKFVVITDDADLIEGLACGPASLDGLADLARELPVYDRAMQRLDAYGEEEAASALERVGAVVDALMLLDEVEGFAGVEKALDAFFCWWDDFVAPAENLGYLGFWAVFEDQGLIAEYVEAIGGPGDAATLQMIAFFVTLARFIRANDALISKIAQLASDDVVAAVEHARVLIARARIALLGAPEAAASTSSEGRLDEVLPDEMLADFCYLLLVFVARTLEDEWLCVYLGIDQEISSDAETIESSLRVIDIMGGK